MSFTIEHDDSKRESFGDYRYKIRKDGRVVAHYWHDFRGDDNGIEFIGGKCEPWPLGKMTDFIEGGGPQPLALSRRAIEYLSKYVI